jgi:hypothetical protein
MTSSYGLSHTDIEQFTGFAYTDLMLNGQQMESTDWISFCTTYIEIIAQIVHKYCNVPTFDPAQPEAAITEYRAGKGPSDDWDYPVQYLPPDYQFYLRELYYPGNGTTIPGLLVYEDVGGKTNPPQWVLRKSRLSGATPEVDAILVTNPATANGTITITLNASTSVNVSVTVGQTIAQTCAAIVAVGAKTDSYGYVWTPTTDGVQYVWWTCGTAAAVSMVQVNVQSTGVVLNPYVQTSGSAGSGGDYEVITKKELTLLSFYNNVPAQGENNVKLVYYTGYDPSSKPYQEIRLEILRCFKNLILLKKSVQAIAVVTATGSRDYSALAMQHTEAQILSSMETATLQRYKRLTMCGPMFD